MNLIYNINMRNKFKFEVGDRVEDIIQGRAIIIESYIKDYYSMDWENSPITSVEMHKDNIYWKTVKKIGDKMDYLYIDGKKIELSDETVANFRKELNKEILVPDNIKITSGVEFDSKGITFNDGKQELYYSYDDNIYLVDIPGTLISCKLTPCKREDLNPGDLAFRSDFSDPNFSKLSKHCIILDSCNYVFTDNKDISINHLIWKYWWKVEEIK